MTSTSRRVWITGAKSGEKGAEPVCEAQRLPVAVLIALELLVVCEGVPLHWRALAWLLLILHWGSMRADDACGIDGARLSWSEVCLKGGLVKTKTTGPGRRVLEIAFFVSSEASLAGVPWLKVGYLIWTSAPYAAQRDNFPLCGNDDMSGPTGKICDPPRLDACFKRLLARLPRIMRPSLVEEVYGPWQLELGNLMIPEALLAFWKGHRPRHWLVSAARAMGFVKDETDYLGRWGILQARSSHYIFLPQDRSP